MKLNLFLLTVLVALVAANLGLNDNPAHRNWEVMPEMVRTVAYKSFTANPNFADGKTMQLPPEGAIARQPAPGHEVTRSGAQVYQTYCQPCHGGAGKGDGPVAQRGFPPPPPLAAPQAVQLSNDEMFQIITQGRKNMPSYAVQVPPQDRWAVISYIRSLQGGSPQ